MENFVLFITFVAIASFAVLFFLLWLRESRKILASPGGPVSKRIRQFILAVALVIVFLAIVYLLTLAYSWFLTFVCPIN